MLQCYSSSFTFPMRQFTFIKLQFLFCVCRKNLIHKVCPIAMYHSDHKESACNAGDPGPIPWSGRFPGGGNGSPLQYSCLENPMDRGAWQATVHGFTKSKTRLRTNSFTFLISQFFLRKT